MYHAKQYHKRTARQRLHAMIAFVFAMSFVMSSVFSPVASAAGAGGSTSLDAHIEWIGEPGDGVIVQLLADGEEVEGGKTRVTSNENWNVTFNNLAVSEGHHMIDYSLDVYDIDGYHTEVTGSTHDGYTVTNLKKNPEGKTTRVTAEKNWIGPVGEPVVMNLMADGRKVDDVTLTEARDWSYTFDQLPVRDNDGEAIRYTIEENNPAGYESTVTEYQDRHFTVNNVGVSGDSPVEGKLITRYVDQDGHKLANRQTLTDMIGESYETSPKAIDGYQLVDTSGKEKGTYRSCISEVVYHYQAVSDDDDDSNDGGITSDEGRVVAHYEDTSGSIIAQRSVKTGKTGSDYHVSAKSIHDYELTSTEGDASGQFTDGTTDVTFVYKQNDDDDDSSTDNNNKGTVIATYVNQDGDTIADAERQAGDTGSDYETHRKSVDGYGFVSVEGDASGMFDSGVQDVVYTYKQVRDDATESGQGHVEVSHVDRYGNELADSETLTGKLGTSYQTKEAALDRYDLVHVNGSTKGRYIDGVKAVEYVYEKQSGGSNPSDEGTVHVRHIDQEGYDIAEEQVLTGTVGDAYKTRSKQLDGWKLDHAEGDQQSGSYAKDDQTVVYVYASSGSHHSPAEGRVLTKYLDGDDQRIAKPVRDSGQIGRSYDTVQKDISGYQFDRAVGETSGKYREGVITVKYIYTDPDKPVDEDDDDSDNNGEDNNNNNQENNDDNEDDDDNGEDNNEENNQEANEDNNQNNENSENDDGEDDNNHHNDDGSDDHNEENNEEANEDSNQDNQNNENSENDDDGEDDNNNHNDNDSDDHSEENDQENQDNNQDDNEENNQDNQDNENNENSEDNHNNGSGDHDEEGNQEDNQESNDNSEDNDENNQEDNQNSGSDDDSDDNSNDDSEDNSNDDNGGTGHHESNDDSSDDAGIPVTRVNTPEHDGEPEPGDPDFVPGRGSVDVPDNTGDDDGDHNSDDSSTAVTDAGDDGGSDDAGGGNGSDNADSSGSDSTNDADHTSDHQSEDKGPKVAETATNTFNLIGLGAAVLVLALMLLYLVNKRRRHDHETSHAPDEYDDSAD